MRQFALAGPRRSVAGLGPALLLGFVLLLGAACAGAPGAGPTPTATAPSSCDAWGTRTFFESASPQDVQLCLDAGADPDGPRDMYQGPPFHNAARATRHPAVIARLVAAGADVSVRDWREQTPLHWAAADNPLAGVAAALLEAGADPDARDLDGITPLHMAAIRSDNPEVVNHLVQAGADVNARGPFGLTPLHMAWAAPQPVEGPAVIRELLRLGADALARDDLGRIADPTHCDHWDTDTFARVAAPADFERCLAGGADVTLRDRQDNTVLHRATGNEDASVIALLLRAGTELEARNARGYTPLHSAIGNRNPAAVTALLDAGADIGANAGSYLGTPLLHAIFQISTLRPLNAATFAIIDLLLEAGADVNAVDEHGDAPLLKILRRGTVGTNTDQVLKLLEAGADPGARGSGQVTPLHMAARYANPVLVNALLDAGADPLVRDSRGSLPLHDAARSGDPEVIARLVRAGAEVNGRNAEGQSPLHLAVLGGPSNGTSAIEAYLTQQLGLSVQEEEPSPWRLRVATLLELGADPNLQDAEGDTPLHLAGQRSDTSLVSLLVDAGADVNARNGSGETPLAAARSHANEPVLRHLLDLGADAGAIAVTGGIEGPFCELDNLYFLQIAPAAVVSACLEAGFPVDERNWNGQTPLLWLVESGPSRRTSDKLAIFLGAGADPDARTRSGETALHHVAGGTASRYGAGWDGAAGLAAAAALLDAGADVNARDSRGETPLHRAARGTSRDTVSMETLLLEAGADVNARGNDGQTPLHLAAALDHTSVLSVLLEAGAEVNARSDAGHTPLHLAMQNARPAAVANLLEAGADPAARDRDGSRFDPDGCERWGTPSFFAFATVDVVADCLGAGADPQIPRQPRPATLPGVRVDGASPTGTTLHVAAVHARDPAVITALVQAGADVNARDDSGHTPLHEAARSGIATVVRALLEEGAEVDARPFRFDPWLSTGGLTPLHNATSNPDPEVAAALLEAGADLGSRGGWQNGTTLHHAARSGNAAVAALLLEAGAHVNARTHRGLTPLHEAARWSPDLLEVLLEAGADVHARGWYGVTHSVDGNLTPLHIATYANRDPEIVTMLLAAGADPNGEVPRADPSAGRSAAAMHGKPGSPLRFAAARDDNLGVVEALLRAGADLELTDADGRTVLHHAATRMPNAFPLLLGLGADPDARDAEGRTPMDYARENPLLQLLERVRNSTPPGNER